MIAALKAAVGPRPPGFPPSADRTQRGTAHRKLILLLAVVLVVAAALAVSLASRHSDPYSGTWVVENAPSEVTVIKKGVGDSYVVHLVTAGTTLTFVKDADRLSTGDAEQHIQAVGGKLKYWVNGTGDVWMVRKQ